MRCPPQAKLGQVIATQIRGLSPWIVIHRIARLSSWNIIRRGFVSSKKTSLSSNNIKACLRCKSDQSLPLLNSWKQSTWSQVLLICKGCISRIWRGQAIQSNHPLPMTQTMMPKIEANAPPSPNSLPKSQLLSRNLSLSPRNVSGSSRHRTFPQVVLYGMKKRGISLSLS